MHRLICLLSAATLVLLSAGCDDAASVNPDNKSPEGGACTSTSDCESGLLCDGSTCVAGDADAKGDVLATDTTQPSDATDTKTDAGDALNDQTGDDAVDMGTCAADRVCRDECCEGESTCFDGACVTGCASGVTCGETSGQCCAEGEQCGADGTCSSPCAEKQTPCDTGFSTVCCDEGSVCQNGGCVLDCGGVDACNGVCCESDEMCSDGQCVADCPSVDKLCGEQSELCCGSEEVCLGNQCAQTGDECTVSENCQLDEYCEPTLGKCVPRDLVEVCEFRPPVGQFAPTVACNWKPTAEFPSFDDVVMTPSVANLTDDNGDGVTNELDIPDIVFTSFDYQANGCCTANGRVRIVSGQCEDGNLPTIYTYSDEFIGNSAGIAIGNLHSDTESAEHPPEIVVVERVGGTTALRRVADDGSDWEVMWKNDTYPTSSHTSAGSTPSIADLNGDGSPEIVIGNVILNGQDGTLIMDGRTVASMGGFTGGVGNNAFLGPSSTVADIDLDGIQEIVAGNTVYEWNGTDAIVQCEYEYTTSNSACQGSLTCDGFNAVANFDADPEAELVIVRQGQVFILEHDCTEKFIMDVPRDDIQPYKGDGPCARNESGPPTVADFDGDGKPEIGTAGADFYVVMDLDCQGDPLPAECTREFVLWETPNRDCSSRATASSVFDFEGDGKAEVVYADETTFRILDGSTGAELYVDDTHSSNTRIEMPVVVDVDNDGKSEVLIPEPNRSSVDLGGIEVWEDADNNWVRTRRIWNQHGYSVTNVTEDGQIPRNPDINWLNTRLNNYRQNVQPAGLFDAPDMQISAIEVDANLCGSGGELTVRVTVTNDGALGVPAGINVFVQATLVSTMAKEAVGVYQTSTILLPKQSEVIEFLWAPPVSFGDQPFTLEAIVDEDGAGNQQYNECFEDNNAATSAEAKACSIN